MTSNVGTVAWCAPEIFAKSGSETSSYSLAADAYSFGMVLYELFDYYPSRFDIADAVCLRGERPPVESALLTKEQPALRSLMEKCWSRDPDMRPAFDEIVDTLEELYANERHEVKMAKRRRQRRQQRQAQTQHNQQAITERRRRRRNKPTMQTEGSLETAVSLTIPPAVTLATGAAAVVVAVDGGESFATGSSGDGGGSGNSDSGGVAFSRATSVADVVTHSNTYF
eukprot:CAMPEP_0171653430 /NCGR_PEP_ID=MMETSP0990-20121206/39547_1 /TAXON_ID=483369 /ORGANISM="non described non described, Strain CCMP2098" /LENGTH=225 /DNA_ID=CAMNT_0012232843 /DNA_START=39 /DNA_END=717 /DNA_ORIENTATION=-